MTESQTRYLAFLRAINVGGHTVKMDELRKIFEQPGFSNVETFIASGNVIFETVSQDTGGLESQIEARLRASLGYEVTAFVRTDREVYATASYPAFSPAQIEAAAAYNIAFLKAPLTQTAIEKLMTLKNDIDDFHVHQREIYWLCQVKQSDSKFSNALLEKTVRSLSSLRGMNTIQKLVKKYPAA